ncbi:MAG: hypothetical protein OEM39_03190 [Acidimicrobiia bacterium]|nr:hypothetical protein [Acidimicrobiia bacterium]
MADKEYLARIRVKLTDDILPQPLLSGEELQARLEESLEAGEADSPIASVSVSDPRTDSRQKRY